MATEDRAPSLDSLCYNVSTLQQLARQGSWRSLIEAISKARKLSLPHFPHEQLVHHAYLVLSHMKLRSYGDASIELDALEDLDSPKYHYQHYPDLYPSRTGSMVPFVLRWLHAELPYRMGQSTLTMERLYALYDRCQQRIERLQASAPLDRSAELQAAPSDRSEVPATIAADDEHHQKAGICQKSVLSPKAMDLNPSPNVTASNPNQIGGSADLRDRAMTRSIEAPIIKDGDGEAEENVEVVKPILKINMLEGAALNNVHIDVQPGQAEPDPEFGDFVSEMGAAINDLEKPAARDVEGTSISATNVLKRWQHRQEFVINCIVSHHLNQRDFVVVLKWFKLLLRKHPSDPWLLSKLGYVQLQLGDLTGGSHTFSEVEKMINKATVVNSLQSSYLKGLVCQNKGLEHIVLKQYSEAIKEFDAALAMNPIDIISANNKALCYMYNRDLIGSTKVLESILDKAPLVALNESLVLNLCSMYELAFVHNAQTKKNLSDWIQQVAPDYRFEAYTQEVKAGIYSQAQQSDLIRKLRDVMPSYFGLFCNY